MTVKPEIWKNMNMKKGRENNLQKKVKILIEKTNDR